MKTDEQNTPTESQKVEAIVKAGVEAKKSDDQILIDIVSAGVSFKKASKLFKQAVESLGLRVSNKDVTTQANDILSAMDFNPKTGDDVKAANDAIVAKVEGSDAKQAAAAIRKYAKANGIELPKAPKGQRGATAGGGFRGKAFAWILENPEATEADFTAYVVSQEKPEAIQKRFLGIFKLVHSFAYKHYENRRAA